MDNEIDLINIVGKQVPSRSIIITNLNKDLIDAQLT